MHEERREIIVRQVNQSGKDSNGEGHPTPEYRFDGPLHIFLSVTGWGLLILGIVFILISVFITRVAIVHNNLADIPWHIAVFGVGAGLAGGFLLALRKRPQLATIAKRTVYGWCILGVVIATVAGVNLGHINFETIVGFAVVAFIFRSFIERGRIK
jgi:hypothetical protein